MYVTIRDACVASIISNIRIIEMPRRERAINVDTNVTIKTAHHLHKRPITSVTVASFSWQLSVAMQASSFSKAFAFIWSKVFAIIKDVLNISWGVERS